MNQFAILFRCKHVPDFRGDTMTPGGTFTWLVSEEGYWQGETFGGIRGTSREKIPGNVVLFDSREQAEKEWTEYREQIGPWWIKPDGRFEVIEVKLKFKQVPDGYEAVK